MTEMTLISGEVNEMIDLFENNDCYWIDSNSFPSSLLSDMAEFIINDVANIQSDDEGLIEAIISSVAIERFVSDYQPTTTKEVTILIYRDWDVFAIDLCHIGKRLKIDGVG